MQGECAFSPQKASALRSWWPWSISAPCLLPLSPFLLRSSWISTVLSWRFFSILVALSFSFTFLPSYMFLFLPFYTSSWDSYVSINLQAYITLDLASQSLLVLRLSPPHTFRESYFCLLHDHLLWKVQQAEGWIWWAKTLRRGWVVNSRPTAVLCIIYNY